MIESFLKLNQSIQSHYTKEVAPNEAKYDVLKLKACVPKLDAFNDELSGLVFLEAINP